MAQFVTGKSGNPAGRPKGSANKASGQLRETIAGFLDENFAKIKEDFDKLKPAERVRFYCDLLQYGVPKLQAIQLESEFSRLPDDQLNYLLQQIMNPSNDSKESNTANEQGG